MSTSSKVETPNPEYVEMLSAWQLTDALMGGTRAMRASIASWLPQEEGEEARAYENRAARSVLFNAFRDTVVDLALRPVSKPTSLRAGDRLPEPLGAIADSVGDEQRDLTQFVFHLLKIALMRGMVHILVDYPPITAANLQEERELGLKPLFLCIDPQDLFAWRYERAPNGEKTLTQIRIREPILADDGAFGVVRKDRIRVIYPDRWELYEQSDDGKEYTLAQEGPYTLGKIGLVTIYLNKTGFMTAASPLEDLAWLNLAHFQSQSDHRNNLRFARSGVIFAKGLSPDDVKKTIVWGVNHSFKTTSPDADMKFVEHSGKAIEAGENELRHLEDQMQAMGKRPLIVKQWGNRTAMSSAIEEGKSQCELQAWVRAMELGLRQAYWLAGDWTGTRDRIPEEFGVDIFDDFGLLAGSDAGLETLFKSLTVGALSLRTYLELLKARGELPGNFDVDQEIQRIAEEGPALGIIGRERFDDGRPEAGEEPEQESEEVLAEAGA